MDLANQITKRTARILLVEPASSARSVIADVLKGLGFGELQLMDTVKNALSYLEVERADWLISSLCLEESINAIHALEIASKYESLKSLRVSLFLDDEHTDYLPGCFELGALSWHKRKFTKDSLKTEFQSLLDLIAKNKGDLVLTSMNYIIPVVKQFNLKDSFLELQKSILEKYPPSPAALLGLAEAQIMCDLKEEAKVTLGRAKTYGYEGWKNVAKDVFKEEELPAAALNLKEVVLVDSDQQALNVLVSAFKKEPGVQVHTFNDGESAFNAIKDMTPDIVIQEWALPKLTGAALLQRIRCSGNHLVPLVIYSSRITKQDMPLLTEMGIAHVLEKPMSEGEFLQEMAFVLNEEKNLLNFKVTDRRIQQLLLAGKEVEAKELMDEIEHQPEFPEGQKKYLQSLMAYQNKDYENARQLAIQALKANGDPVRTLNILGKSLTKLRQFADAYKCLKKAQDLSPKNVERLCEIAEAQFQLNEISESDASIDRAKSIDANAQVISNTEASISIQSGDISAARSAIKKLESPEILIAEMNNTAVVFVLSGEFEKGIQLYHQTIEALSESRADLRQKVIYNLALAHARKKDYPKAKEALELMTQAQIEKAPKIHSLWARLSKSIETKEELVLNSATAEHVETPESGSGGAEGGSGDLAEKPAGELERILTGFSPEGETEYTPKSGDLCCFGLFKILEGKDPKWEEVKKNPPPFTPRDSIKRDEAMGVERAMK